MNARDEPLPLRDALAAVGKQLGLPSTDVVATITERLRELAGDAVARHAEVRSVHDGACTIAVDGPGFATRIRYLENDLVTSVQARCGSGSLTSVRVVVGGP